MQLRGGRGKFRGRERSSQGARGHGDTSLGEGVGDEEAVRSMWLDYTKLILVGVAMWAIYFAPNNYHYV